MISWEIVAEFERKIGIYTGAPFVAAVDSCTAAIHLAFEWYKKRGGLEVSIPHKTYRSVANMAWIAGLDIWWSPNPWAGVVQLTRDPVSVWDCALRFTGGMYRDGTIQCVSFHPQKPFHFGFYGGAILCDDKEAHDWFIRAAYDGRVRGMTTFADPYDMIGWHYPMSPTVAAAGIQALECYPKSVPDSVREYEDVAEKFPCKKEGDCQ
jgi:dTDP-4-amino-4,6-dideoxygalactose transaminase